MLKSVNFLGILSFSVDKYMKMGRGFYNCNFTNFTSGDIGVRLNAGNF